jgi:hypothetical protein
MAEGPLILTIQLSGVEAVLTAFRGMAKAMEQALDILPEDGEWDYTETYEDTVLAARDVLTDGLHDALAFFDVEGEED